VAFKLKKRETAAEGIRRVAREEIDTALALTKDKRSSPETVVHELRKQLKKLRAIVRLVEDELGERIADRDNQALRDLGRRLSPARDASVRVTAVRHLLDGKANGRPKRMEAVPADRIRKRLASRQAAALAHLRRNAELPAIRRELESLRRRVRRWPLRKEGFDCLERGLRRSYRRGRKGRAEAFASRTDEAFHDWRKRAKDLRYQVGLLEPVWPPIMKDFEKTLHDLTDRLGDDHDLADLRQVFRASPRLTSGGDGATPLIERIDSRRSDLQAKARPLGTRVYAEKAGAFSRRVESYWDAWKTRPRT
jgi:CHAD domain-containing protein